MIFDVYEPFKNKEGRIVPGVKPHPMEWSEIKAKVLTRQDVREKIVAHREGQEGMKIQLPAICFVGRSTSTRKASAMVPTQLVMIDIDHCREPEKAWDAIKARLTEQLGWDWVVDNVMVAHLTPSRGLHIFFKSQPGCATLQENMAWMNEVCDFGQYGDYDEVVHDFARISFAFLPEELLFESAHLLLNTGTEFPEILVNENLECGMRNEECGMRNVECGMKNVECGVPALTEEDMAEIERYDYCGVPVKLIVEKWVETKGEPGHGQVHNYYNDMVKNFRNLVNNDKRVLFGLLPRFGHSAEECWGSIESICRKNTTSKHERGFYAFLVKNGFYQEEMNRSLKQFMLDEKNTAEPSPSCTLPWMPPVFRELIGMAPMDFKVSACNALLPIMGTLTSYLEAEYYFDARIHTTSFFSVVHAPAGVGKGFAERYMNLLTEQLAQRDAVQSRREEIYTKTVNRKGDNEKAPEDPCTSLRIMPTKNSETELLQKQRNNHGYHMLTFAEEVDSWAKGVKAAGGNKDDMLRVAWDNGKYGQQFKGTNTFKGKVNLYWNVLITGTLPRVLAYFKNVEDGLVTRCSFTTIYNQEFAEAAVWKRLTEKERGVIERFLERCDRNTYTKPCTLTEDDVMSIPESQFDKEVDWRFTFREKQRVSMEWLRPAIERFLKAELVKASLNYDRARDTFRKRVAVRGFRLGMMMYALWEKPRRSDLMKCIPFIEWWMKQDLESSLELWGVRYNNETETEPSISQRSLYTALPAEFTKTDIFNECLRQNIKTPVRVITCKWKQLGVIEKTGKGEYRKVEMKV